ncbi:MAG: hypothetical protein M3P83_08025, partial [Actinomycetota bacterium]|nr:hypothetical protein [Actinomycetota bacterium]
MAAILPRAPAAARGRFVWQARGVEDAGLTDAGLTDAVLAAVVDEVMKKSGVCWLRYPGSERERPVWQVWRDGSAYVVSGGPEQPLPGIDQVDQAVVVTRSRDSRERVLAWRAHVTRLAPGDQEYDDAVRALLADRLNLEDFDETRRTWAERCTVTRLEPTGVVEEYPGALPDGDLAQVPPATPATTRGALPRVLHKR